MPGSSTKVNYYLRTAKQIERKMLLEAVRNLSNFANLTSYQYIGFGASYFVDFTLFHKMLGLTNLVSIESDPATIDRCQFNKPFRCIEIMPGMSGHVLPRLKWQHRSILWLDYDNVLDQNVLSDISFTIENVASGSLVLISVDARNDDFEIDPKATLRKLIGVKNMPPGIAYNKDFSGWGTAKIFRHIINQKIVSALSARNGRLDPGHKMVYQQLFNFHYADGTKMLTVGGIVYDESEKTRFAECNFESLEFYKPTDSEYHIEVPRLTNREIKYLDSNFPCPDLIKIKRNGIPIEDVEKYYKVYRYFPTFVESEF